jgi:hypothetical protein
METLGSKVDQLAVVTVKLYVTQDRIHEAAQKGESLPAEIVKRLVDLNLARNRLMTEIDTTLAEAVSTGKVAIDPRPKIL